MKPGRLLILFSIILLACSSGKQAYERGDYYGAVMKAVQRLRQNPDHSKSLETLKNAYPLAVEYFETEANNQIASNSAFKWKNAIQSYDQVNNLYEAVRQCPGCKKAVPNPKNHYAEIGPLKEKAADESYNAGIEALMKGERNEAKKAYFNFSDAQAFVPGYKDVVEYLDKAMFEATLKVIIEQIPVPARYNLSGGFFQDKVEEFLHNNYTQQSFIKFYTPEEAKVAQLPYADQIIRIQFDDFSVGNTLMKEKEETVSRDSVKVGETKVNGKMVPVYNTVKAKLTTYRKELSSNGLLSMIVVDAKTNGVLTHRKFPGEYVWVSQWARFNGDERALSDEQLRICRQKELQPPGPQDLFLEFTKPIYNQLIPSVRNFYQSY
ncbi:hypothetical protein SAMN04488109_0549 [Chryseolinea serpens]|uniref:Tetratricopeptide repeat-containing protein n=1 Tax=Chryseolinea serpens TaxID=947013 RepID=A0A1M5KBI1_9BACT|nr:hypothetical protein [Chryseolinea serpens]SHG50145.1 hypothetical protein SAMN04488109_0549 [Chryseolinea serpens]